MNADLSEAHIPNDLMLEKFEFAKIPRTSCYRRFALLFVDYELGTRESLSQIFDRIEEDLGAIPRRISRAESLCGWSVLVEHPRFPRGEGDAFKLPRAEYHVEGGRWKWGRMK